MCFDLKKYPRGEDTHGSPSNPNLCFGRIRDRDCEAHFSGRSTEAPVREGPAHRLPSQGCHPHVLPLRHQCLSQAEMYTQTLQMLGQGLTHFPHLNGFSKRVMARYSDPRTADILPGTPARNSCQGVGQAALYAALDTMEKAAVG